MFLSSHILSEVEALCDRVGILTEGPAGRRGHARRAAAPADPRRSRSRSAAPPPELSSVPGVAVVDVAGNSASPRGDREPAAVARCACRPARAVADEPGAVARGDLPAPLRRPRARCAPVARSPGARSPMRAVRTPRSPRSSRSSRPRTSSATGAATRRSRSALPLRGASASNKAVELFYGSPHDLLTVGGYAAWRVGGIGALIAAIFGLLAAIRALRAEEDSGRQELVLAGAISRRTAYLAALAASAREPRCSGSPSSSASRQPGCPSEDRRCSRSRRSLRRSCSRASERSHPSSRRRGASRSSSRRQRWCSRTCSG